MTARADDLYSALLLLALAAVAIAAGALAAALWSRVAEERRRWLRRAVAAGLAAALLSLVSAILHWVFGHRPGTASGLTLAAFLAAHRANVTGTLAGLALAAIASARVGRGRRGP